MSKSTLHLACRRELIDMVAYPFVTEVDKVLAEFPLTYREAMQYFSKLPEQSNAAE